MDGGALILMGDYAYRDASLLLGTFAVLFFVISLGITLTAACKLDDLLGDDLSKRVVTIGELERLQGIFEG